MDDFTLRDNGYQLTENEITLLRDHPPVSASDWTNARYYNYKSNVKRHLVLRQLDRCAYCRKQLEAEGKYEPLDHIVAKTIKPAWLFNVRNLILTCDSCNNLKGTEPILTQNPDELDELPGQSAEYTIFNPHFDSWSDHLLYEEEIFIVGIPDSKGYETIRVCKLYRFNVIINRSKELKLGQKAPLSMVIQRYAQLDQTNQDYQTYRTQLLAAIDHFIQRMEDNPDFN